MSELDPRRPVAEFLGTGLLVLAVVGSGIMAETLSQDVGLQLFENAFATAGALLALILAFGPVSGAHFNPVVSLAERVRGRLGTAELGSYVLAQMAGGMAGVIAANIIFDLDPITVSEKSRAGLHLLVSEGIATAGLLLVIYGVVTAGTPVLAAGTVAGYIGGAYFFTSSTSFANPAVTVARMFSDTFAGIAPTNAIGFIVAQLIAATLTIVLMRWLFARNADPF